MLVAAIQLNDTFTFWIMLLNEIEVNLGCFLLLYK